MESAQGQPGNLEVAGGLGHPHPVFHLYTQQRRARGCLRGRRIHFRTKVVGSGGRRRRLAMRTVTRHPRRCQGGAPSSTPWGLGSFCGHRSSWSGGGQTLQTLPVSLKRRFQTVLAAKAQELGGIWRDATFWKKCQVSPELRMWRWQEGEGPRGADRRPGHGRRRVWARRTRPWRSCCKFWISSSRQHLTSSSPRSYLHFLAFFLSCCVR